MKRPADRTSFVYRVYCDLVCGMKLHRSKRVVFEIITEERGIPLFYVRRVYDRFIRPNLATGMAIEELF